MFRALKHGFGSEALQSEGGRASGLTDPFMDVDSAIGLDEIVEAQSMEHERMKRKHDQIAEENRMILAEQLSSNLINKLAMKPIRELIEPTSIKDYEDTPGAASSSGPEPTDGIITQKHHG